LKYQLAIDIQVISTLVGAANVPAGKAVESHIAATAIHLRFMREILHGRPLRAVVAKWYAFACRRSPV
jgi:hypothetical protein